MARRETAASPEWRGGTGRTGVRGSRGTREPGERRARPVVTACPDSQERGENRAARATLGERERRETVDCQEVRGPWGTRGLKVPGAPKESEEEWGPQEVRGSRGHQESRDCRGRLARQGIEEPRGCEVLWDGRERRGEQPSLASRGPGDCRGRRGRRAGWADKELPATRAVRGRSV